MSWQPCPDPTPGDAHAADLIETVTVPRARDLGSFEVRRALPSAQRQMVGPFIFFDQMGPSEFLLGAGRCESPANVVRNPSRIPGPKSETLASTRLNRLLDGRSGCAAR